MPSVSDTANNNSRTASPSEEARQLEGRRQRILQQRGASNGGVGQEVIEREGMYHRGELQNAARSRREGSPLCYTNEEMRALRPTSQRSDGVNGAAQDVGNRENQPPVSAAQPDASRISGQQTHYDLDR